LFPWLRLIRVAMGLPGARRIALLDTTRVRLRVWPNDLDINLHANNGKCLSLADIGRFHWFARAGLLGIARRRKVYPVIGDSLAKFRRELHVFQSFEIHTRLIGWDSKWGFLEHRFVRAGRVIGVVAVRGVFTGPGGMVSPSEFLGSLGHDGPSPQLPAWAEGFHRSSELLSEAVREEERAAGLR
jgi:acyl-CoA thioesterase FadM